MWFFPDIRQEFGIGRVKAHAVFDGIPYDGSIVNMGLKNGRSFSREGQSHFCGKIETIDQYIEEQDDTVKPYLNEVRQILHTALPETQEKISWSMPTFWKGRNIIHFAASKKHLGLYPGGEATTVFADRLAGFDVSKGTIRFSYNKPLPKELITDIARWCYEHYAK